MKRFALLTVLCSLLVVVPSLAQDGKKPRKFNSKKGYSIVIPAGWVKVGGETPIPEDLRKRAEATGLKLEETPDEDRFVSDAEVSDFVDNMGIQVQEPMQLTDEAVDELRNMLVPSYKKIFGEFKLIKFERKQFGINDGIHIVAAYKMDGTEVVMDQGVILTTKGSLIVTCSMGRARMLEVRRACEDSFKTVAFK